MEALLLKGPPGLQGGESLRIESRFVGEERRERMEATERRERVEERRRRVSWSDKGEGPGTGGRGAAGGREGGGLREAVERGREEVGEGGMWFGGKGKASRRTGTACFFGCLIVVVVVVAVAVAEGMKRVCERVA
jgi:hypothetical protein